LEVVVVFVLLDATVLLEEAVELVLFFDELHDAMITTELATRMNVVIFMFFKSMILFFAPDKGFLVLRTFNF
jgi:hypothetical protein